MSSMARRSPFPVAGTVLLLRKGTGSWGIATSLDGGPLAKRPGLQGPIDDAFWDRFIMVKPTGLPLHEATGKWVEGEMAHAIDHWRRQFRGEALVKTDAEISDADIAASNLVLWGDPASNKILAKIAEKLPLTWNAKELRLGEQAFDAAHSVAVMIYPNPLNPKKYVVLNSGFTFREYDYLNNARQVPKLPDYAMIDVNVPADAPSREASRQPGSSMRCGSCLYRNQNDCCLRFALAPRQREPQTREEFSCSPAARFSNHRHSPRPLFRTTASSAPTNRCASAASAPAAGAGS